MCVCDNIRCISYCKLEAKKKFESHFTKNRGRSFSLCKLPEGRNQVSSLL